MNSELHEKGMKEYEADLAVNSFDEQPECRLRDHWACAAYRTAASRVRYQTRRISPWPTSITTATQILSS